MTAYFNDIYKINSAGLFMPPAKQFDETYKTIRSLIVEKRVLQTFIKLNAIPGVERQLFEDLDVERTLVFVYIYANNLFIKDRVQETVDASFYLKFLFDDETLRDVLLESGNDFFERVSSLLLRTKNKSVSRSFSNEIITFFQKWLNVEFYRTVVLFKNKPDFTYSNNLVQDPLTDSFMMHSFIETFHREFRNNQLRYHIHHLIGIDLL